MLKYVLIFLAISFLPKIIARFQSWLATSEIRFVQPTIKPISNSEVPKEYLPIFEFAKEQLESRLGFRHRGTTVTQRELPESLAAFSEIFISPDGSTLAFASFNVMPAAMPFAVSYVSLTETGHRIETVDCISPLLLESASHISDSATDDFVLQWQTHQGRLEELKNTSTHRLVDFVNYSLDEIIDVESTDMSLQHELLTEKEIAKAASKPGTFKYSMTAAWEIAAKMLSANNHIATVRQQLAARRASSEAQPFSTEADVAELEWFTKLRSAISSRRSLTTKVLMLIVSAILFFAVFGYWLGPVISAMLLVIVFVHELGHVSAMALFGYRNRQVLFIPFFGAAAYGEKNEAPAWQQLIVLFMGPIPGIIIGLILYGVYQSMAANAGEESRAITLIQQIAWATFILNYINLFPIGFLDGGKIVQILYLSRFPRARFVFQAISALAFVVLAIWMQNLIVGIIGLFSILALPSHWRFGTTIKTLRQSFDKTFADQDSSNYEKRLAVFRMLREPPNHALGPQDRSQLATQLIHHVETSKAGLPTILIGTAFYLVSLLSALILIAMTVLSS